MGSYTKKIKAKEYEFEKVINKPKREYENLYSYKWFFYLKIKKT